MRSNNINLSNLEFHHTSYWLLLCNSYCIDSIDDIFVEHQLLYLHFHYLLYESHTHTHTHTHTLYILNETLASLCLLTSPKDFSAFSVLWFFCHARSFKGSSYTHKYECWEYVMTSQVCTFRLQNKSDCELILLNLLYLTYSLSGDASQTGSSPYPCLSSVMIPLSLITLILSLFHLIFFYGSGISTYSALIWVTCPRMILELQALSFPCWLQTTTQRNNTFSVDPCLTVEVMSSSRGENLNSSLYTDRHIHHHKSVFLSHVSSSIRESALAFEPFSLAYRTP